MPERAESLAGVIEPVLASLDLELFDLELTGSGGGRILRVVVDRTGGVDLDAITAATQAIAPLLDSRSEKADPSLAGPYALEVSSPGLERPLRRPDHYRRAVGSTVSVKTRDDQGAARRVRGVLTAADDDGVNLETDAGPERIAYADVTQARTVFEWGSPPKPAPKRKKKKEKARS